MHRILFVTLISIICCMNISFASKTSNIDPHQYDSLFNAGKYEEVIKQVGRFLEIYEAWGTKSENGEGEEALNYPEGTDIYARNLMADSYRMLQKYGKARDWYAGTVDGYFDSYAEYCLQVMKRISIIIGTPFKPKITGYYGAILFKLLEDIPLKDKQQYFKNLASKGKEGSWLTQLYKFCAGNVSLDKFLLTVPKENIIIAYTYAGLALEVKGEINKARQLYNQALLQKNSTNIELLLAANRLGLLELIMIDAPDSIDIAVKSSSAKLEGKRLYSIKNLIDNDSTTAWVPESKKSGVGEWLEFSFDESVQIYSLTLINGYAKSENSFKNNNRVKSATLEFSDGSKQKVTLEDTMQTQIIQINKTAQKFRLYIDEVYKGIKYDDTCLSEMDVKYEIPEVKE